MTDQAFEAAVQMLAKGDAPPPSPDPAPAPVPEQPAAPTTTPAEPTSVPPQEPPKTEPPPTPDDGEAKLRADLEARRQQRQQRAPQVDVTTLQAKIEQLEQRLQGQPQAQANLQALIAQHGEVEALRMVGIDPLQFFDGFKKHAQRTNPQITAAERAALEAKAEAEALRKRLDERDAHEKQASQHHQQTAIERLYLESTKSAEWADDPALKLEYLHKMEPHERLRATHAEMERLANEGYDIQHLTDRQLAKLVDMTIRDQIRRLTGNDAGSTTQTTAPATDGQKPTQATPAALTNAVAAEASGRERLLTEDERFAAAVRKIQNAT